MSGKAFVYGDNVDTDMLAPGLYMKFGIEDIARHCLEAVDPTFAATVRAGDFVVGGDNFGMGSSREQAPQALRHLGVAAVIARSFAGLFFRNAVNLGLAPLVCADIDKIAAGDELAVDAARGTIQNRTTGLALRCEALPAHLLAMLNDGGLIPHLEKKLKAARK
ncbi:MAG: 3-isopropylmalate dehydratase [Magnetospirillum sp.]|jgi:3-isopropylmalate/(R)-2-methylmalate dehydratase small subunit|nr:3-isopropylmalate dehydratase [Magnetospirillum sp.]